MPKRRPTPTAVSCPPRRPNSARTMAARTEPRMEPAPTVTPVSRAADAPISASSEVPWTVKDMCRMTTSGVTTPDTTPSSAAAMSADWTNPTPRRVWVSASQLSTSDHHQLVADAGDGDVGAVEVGKGFAGHDFVDGAHAVPVRGDVEEVGRAHV